MSSLGEEKEKEEIDPRLQAGILDVMKILNSEKNKAINREEVVYNIANYQNSYQQ